MSKTALLGAVAGLGQGLMNRHANNQRREELHLKNTLDMQRDAALEEIRASNQMARLNTEIDARADAAEKERKARWKELRARLDSDEFIRGRDTAVQTGLNPTYQDREGNTFEMNPANLIRQDWWDRSVVGGGGVAGSAGGGAGGDLEDNPYYSEPKRDSTTMLGSVEVGTVMFGDVYTYDPDFNPRIAFSGKLVQLPGNYFTNHSKTLDQDVELFDGPANLSLTFRKVGGNPQDVQIANTSAAKYWSERWDIVWEDLMRETEAAGVPIEYAKMVMADRVFSTLSLSPTDQAKNNEQYNQGRGLFPDDMGADNYIATILVPAHIMNIAVEGHRLSAQQMGATLGAGTGGGGSVTAPRRSGIHTLRLTDLIGQQPTNILSQAAQQQSNP